MLNGVKVIGVICATINKEPSKPLIDNLAKLLYNSSEYKMLVFQCFEEIQANSPNDTGGLSVFKLINYDIIDVMIIVPVSLHSLEHAEALAANCLSHGVPIISVDIPLTGAFCVSFDYIGAFGALVEHVLSWHSCKRVKLVAGTVGNYFSDLRVDTCRRIMQEHGLELGENNILYGDFWEGPTMEAMDKFFESGEPLPEVFICCNDTMAMTVCLKLNEHGINVPDDVLVTGFDGIQIEKFHKPRLTTAVRDNEGLAETILDLTRKILSGEASEPYRIDLDYNPVFSESCNCGSPDLVNSNRMLADFVRNYSYTLNYEEHINNMENLIAADPSPANVHRVVREFGFKNSVICLTDEFCRCFSDGESKPEKFSGFNTMHVFACTFSDGRKSEKTVFPAARLIPLLENSFSEYNTLLVIPLHFQDSVQGYIVTHYVNDEHHNERLYTFTTSLDRCLETMRIHEHLSSLNQRLEFMFTHDQLTKIYNRYGFYKGFRESYAALDGQKCDVFIISIDLNDMKYINDNFGHSAGDDALCITASALTGAAEISGGVICSRFGGDEFVAAKVCCGNAAKQAEEYHRNFVEILDHLNSTSGKPYKVHVGLGVYSATLDRVDSIDELIELADRLMYSDKAKHKRHPRNTV